MQCQHKLSLCSASLGIKRVLKQFDAILSSSVTSATLEKNANQLLDYTNVQLMNYFYHVKYDHNTNDDKQKFQIFYQFLCDGDNVRCDLTQCQSARKYIERRHQTSSISMSPEDTHNKETEIPPVSAFHILSRIHTYFIHSHDVSQLCNHERKYLSRYFKYIETKYECNQCIDGHKMSSLLIRNGIAVEGNELQLIFDKTQYHMTQLMTDLCTIFTNRASTGTLLSSIIMEALHLEDNDIRNQQAIYESILYSGFITKTDLNHHNFIKILNISVCKVNPQLNLQAIEQIASNTHLTGNVFLNGTAEFMKSLKFGKLFKSIKNWNKKQWVKIYVNIQKWTSSRPNYNDVAQKYNEAPNADDIDQMYNEAQIDYIDIGTDAHTIHTFCTLTNTTKDIAFSFLQETSWNIEIAVDRYFAFDGNINSFPLCEHNIDNEAKEEHSEYLIYNNGVAFWYWDCDKKKKRYIGAKCKNLKDEVLHFTHQMSMRIWITLLQECRLLQQLDHVKKITHNGNRSNIYAIKHGDVIDLDHLLSIKLYTDCTVLCAIFCKAFRLKKVSSNHDERMQSLMHRNSKVANWARLLIESVQSYGTVRVTKTKYYRGLNSSFVFGRFITRYNAPLSTTEDLSTAATFVKDDTRGLVMELTLDNDYVSGLNTSKISSFSEEKEVLFFGAVLRLSSVHQYYAKTWRSYKQDIKGIQIIRQIANGSIEWNR
eukprot:970394_1